MRFAFALVAILVAGGAAFAQHRHPPASYAGLQQRAVKALSGEQIADLRAGRGMSLALAAELNGYPGPLHVLELADQLHLSADQRQKMRELTDAMKAEAIPAGEELIAHEGVLDEAFAGGKIDAALLGTLTTKIGEAQGKLRAVHLKYHLTTAELLSAHQRLRYAELRGYR